MGEEGGKRGDEGKGESMGEREKGWEKRGERNRDEGKMRSDEQGKMRRRERGVRK